MTSRSTPYSPIYGPCPVTERHRPRLRSIRTSQYVALALVSALAATSVWPVPGWARSLDSVRFRGTLGICAHPNSLPYAHKNGEPPGFQIEVGRALAEKLGVSLTPVWVISSFQIRRADCDIVLDAISNQQAQEESGLSLSKPYYRGGVILAVRPDSQIGTFRDLNGSSRVAVQVGSIASMLLNERGVPISTYGFQDEMLDAVANREVDAAIVTPAAAGYFNTTHEGHALRVIGPDEQEPDLVWNVSVGMMKPDKELRAAIENAMDQLQAEGTLERIYARYGMALHPPK